MPGNPLLRDVERQAEIELVSALVLAARQADGPLSQERIDVILGVPASSTEAPMSPDDAGPPVSAC
ncbi:MAG: hypothetical protein ACRCXL_02880 [Dermatophilaceae bacterium]